MSDAADSEARKQAVVEAAERAAAEILAGATQDAERHVGDARRRAEAIGRERVEMMSAVSDSLLEQANTVKRQADVLIEALDRVIASLEEERNRPARPAQQPPVEYARFVSDGGRRKLVYYTARHMEQSCIGCHNHPDGVSPKKDWVVGDVVGVLKIVRPLDREIQSTREGLRGALTLMLSIAGVLLAVFVIVAVATQRRRKGDAA